MDANGPAIFAERIADINGDFSVNDRIDLEATIENEESLASK